MERMMNATNVMELYASWDAAGLTVWIDGGWAVDALLGMETRTHTDLDIAIEYTEVPNFRSLMEARGYREVERDEDKKWTFVLSDGKGHEVDVHAFHFDARGNIVETEEYPQGSLEGTGVIHGQRVRCIDAKHLVDFHTRYEPREKDFPDVAALCEKFGIPYPKGYARLEKN